MMGKKRNIKPDVRLKAELPLEEVRELEMILDRLSVQSPEGESLGSYLDSLRNALKGREKLVVALIDEVARKPSEVGLQAFLRLQDLIETQKYAKVKKQAAYRFSQRGFSMPQQELPERKVVLVQKEARDSISHMVPMGEGFWFLTSLLHEADFLEPTAISAYVPSSSKRTHIRVAETSHKAYRDYIRKIMSNVPRKPVEIPVWHAARLFEEMIEFFGAEGSPFIIERARKVFQPLYDPQRLPYVYDLMPVLEEPQAYFSEIDIKALLQNVPNEWLTFPKEELLPFWEKINELDRPVLVIPKEVQQERSLGLIDKAANELCVAKKRLIFQRFFEEEAMWHKLSGSGQIANWAWVVAQHLRTTSTASENPVIRKMIALSMRRYWPEEFKPKEAGSEQFQQTDSGLIVPR